MVIMNNERFVRFPVPSDLRSTLFTLFNHTVALVQ